MDENVKDLLRPAGEILIKMLRSLSDGLGELEALVRPRPEPGQDQP